MSTKILDLIAQLEAEIAESPKPKMAVGGHKRIVDFDRIMDLIGDIRVTIPDEVRVAQSVLNERDALLSKAAQEAKAIYETAQNERERMIDGEDILKEARRRAKDILSQARESSRAMSVNACGYADDILCDVQRYILDYSRIIDDNRKELSDKYSASGAETQDTYAEEPYAAKDE